MPLKDLKSGIPSERNVKYNESDNNQNKKLKLLNDRIINSLKEISVYKLNLLSVFQDKKKVILYINGVNKILEINLELLSEDRKNQILQTILDFSYGSTFNQIKNDSFNIDLCKYLLREYNDDIKIISNHSFIELIIKNYVKTKINDWQKKGEFEKTIDYQNRVTEINRKKMIDKYEKEALEIEVRTYNESIDFKKIELREYDADNETFLLYSPDLGEIIMNVPISKAKYLRDKFSYVKYQKKKFVYFNDQFILISFEMIDYLGNIYVYNNKNQSAYTQTLIEYNFPEIEVNIPNQIVTTNNNIKKTNTISVGKSDVDVNIPINSYKNKNKYALVIGNEDYSSKQTNLSTEQDVEFARNDANSFKNYLTSTLGFMEDHVTLLADATAGMINRETAKLVQLAKLDPKSEIVFYYAGHGLPDDDKNPYLLPVDVSTINLEEDGLPLKELYSKLASSNAAKITVFLDACFSGGGRDQGLHAARGVKIKPKEEAFTGNMVVFASSSSEERSLPYEEKQHGFFTYFLLKKLQETKGNASYGELSEYIKKEVARSSLLKKSLKQTPHTNISSSAQDKWKTWSFR